MNTKNLHEHFEHAGGTPDVGNDEGKDVQTVGFDYETVIQNLDGEGEQPGDMAWTLAASGVAVLLDWIEETFISRGGIAMRPETSRNCKALILRNYVRREGMTMEQIGGRVGIAKQHVSEVWLDFCDRFHVTSAISKARLAKARLAKAGRNCRNN